MWKRLQKELMIEYYWWRRKMAKHWSYGKTPGLLALLIGLVGFIFIGQIFAAIIRGMVLVGTYWSSVALALIMSAAFVLLTAILAAFIAFCFLHRERK